MNSPHSSARYAVIRGTLIGAPVGTVYSVVAVHAVDDNSLIVSQLYAGGAPMKFSAPVLVVAERVLAMMRNSADASEYAARLRQEDQRAER